MRPKDRAQAPEKNIERNPQWWEKGGGRTWEEQLLREEGGFQGCTTNSSRLVKGAMRQIYREVVRTGPLEEFLEKHILRTILSEFAGMDVKYM